MPPLTTVLKGIAVCAKYLFAGPLVAPRNTGRFLQMLGHTILAYDRAESCARIPRQPLGTVFPGIEQTEVVLADASWRDGNVSMAELYCLCAIARHQHVHSAFEIGTFDGLVMAQLARNTDAQTRLITVDLRPEDLPRLRRPLAHGDIVYVQKATIGEKVERLPSALRTRVIQLYGDSTQLDFSPYEGQIDLVFIDGSHEYHYVEHDSQEAFRLRSPSGIIIWQDYLAWPDVTRYLNRLQRDYPLIHLEGTSLVIYRPA
jgi:predicted O-methyltransferase YrrM